VHPTIWLKLLFWFASPFVSKKVWSKLKYIEQIMDLQNFVNFQQLKLPDYIFEYDKKNGAV